MYLIKFLKNPIIINNMFELYLSYDLTIFVCLSVCLSVCVSENFGAAWRL